MAIVNSGYDRFFHFNIIDTAAWWLISLVYKSTPGSDGLKKFICLTKWAILLGIVKYRIFFLKYKLHFGSLEKFTTSKFWTTLLFTLTEFIDEISFDQKVE